MSAKFPYGAPDKLGSGRRLEAAFDSFTNAMPQAAFQSVLKIGCAAMALPLQLIASASLFVKPAPRTMILRLPLLVGR
jgi:hypothetical protein